jgi:hypothetical protein
MNTSCISLVWHNSVVQLAAHLVAGIVALVLITGVVAPAKREAQPDAGATVTVVQPARKTAAITPTLLVAERAVR